MMQPLAEREDPGKWKAVTLTVVMHLLLVGALFLGVRWHNRPPEAVMVEVWRDVPAQPAPPPVAPAPPPAPEPVPKAPVAPKAEPKPVLKPDIAIKAEKPKPKPEPEPKPAAKPEPKPLPKAAEPKRPEPNFANELKREMEQIERDKTLREKHQRAEQEARLLAQAAADKATEQAAAAKRRGLEQYEGKIQRKIRGNLSHPELKGNPVAQFTVIQLPSGEVLDVQLKKTSGVATYDAAIQRAIWKSSPLPKPDDPALFARELTLTFCPDEERGCR